MTIPPPDGAALRALVELGEKATPGPYRAHDHNGMAKVGEKPADWVGYAWVGRVTKNSNPDGTFDAGWANMDRREDGHKEYRERASVDAHFVAAACNFVRDALPALLEALSETTRERNEARARVGELVKANREAITLIDELNERASSRLFWDIGQTLHAKLCTVRATLARTVLRTAARSGGG